MDLTAVVAVSALALSALSFYRSFLYVKQELGVTVTEVSYVTNQSELYMTIAFSNDGNRDAAVLRVEPTLWSRNGKSGPEWTPLSEQVDARIPLTSPTMPTVVRAGGVEVVTLSAVLDPAEAERALVSSQRAAFLGIRVATMNSEGNLYRLELPVARLSIDSAGKIANAEPAIHRSVSGFADVQNGPPGDMLQANKQTPFVWAARHF